MPKRQSATGRYKQAKIWSLRKRKVTLEEEEEGTKLFVSFVPKGSRRDIRLDVSRLLKVPLCAHQFALALLSTDRSLRMGSVITLVRSLDSGFIRYLCQEGIASTFTTKDMTTALFNRFIETFLSRKNEDHTWAIKDETRRHLLGAVRSLLGGLIRNGEPLPHDSTIRKNPWPRRSRSAIGKSDQSDQSDPNHEVLGRLYRFCCLQIEARMNEVRRLWEIEKVEEARVNELMQRGWTASEAIAAQRILLAKALFGSALPQRREVEATPLWPMISSFGYKEMARAFGPYASDLCPFVFYLLYHTGFNQQPLVDLKVSQIGELEFEGTSFRIIQSKKRRAHVAYDDEGLTVLEGFVESTDPMSPYNVIPFLIRWTSGIRDQASSDDEDNLFIYQYRNRDAGQSIQSYAHGESPKTRFNTHSGSFCRLASIRWTGAKEIRRLISEIAHDVTRGNLEKVSEYLKHGSLETTISHYRTDTVKNHAMDFLGRGVNLRQRWCLSGGKIECRNVHKDHDHSAATAPFRCIDPFDSPLRSEEPGRMCRAYGSCPDCPHSMLQINSSYAAARCVELRTLYMDQRSKMQSETFEERWGAQLRALDERWIPAFDPSIWPVASEQTLASMPPLE